LQDRQEKVTDTGQKLKDAQDNLAKVVQNGNDVAKHRSELLDTIAQKEKDGRKATDELKQSSNQLHEAWKQLATVSGPSLITVQKGWNDALAISILNVEDAIVWLGGLGKAIDEANTHRLNSIGGYGGHWETVGGGGHAGGGRQVWVPDPYGGPGDAGFTAPSREIGGTSHKTDGQRELEKQTAILQDIRQALGGGSGTSGGTHAGHRSG
jgi:hypothetical protein